MTQVEETSQSPDDNRAFNRLAVMFRALRSRNLRLYFTGQGISLIGLWMTRVATSWLVYRLTDSALLLGVVGFASQIPIFFLAPFAGVMVDRWNRHRLIIFMQSIAMLQALTLAALTLTGVVAVWHIITLGVLQGFISAFDLPARQSFLVKMVDRKEDLSNAIALNSSIFNGARLIGPSIAGVVIATAGEGICFLIDGLSYTAVLAALLSMRVPAEERPVGRPTALRQLADGWKYVTSFTPIRSILMMLAWTSLVGLPYLVLMPVISRELLGGQSKVFGFLMAAAGLGAVGGGLFLAARRSVLGLGRMIPLAAALFGVTLVGLALSRIVWVSLLFMTVLGFLLMVQIAASNTLLQTIVDEDKRGRVMSYYAMALIGTAPFGSLLAGGAAELIGTPGTLVAGGFCLTCGAAAFARRLPAIREQVHPIYVRLGILPEIATGLQAAANATTPPRE